MDDCRWVDCPEVEDTLDTEYEEYLLWSREIVEGADDFSMSPIKTRGNSIYYSSSAGSNHVAKVRATTGLEYWKWPYQFFFTEDIYLSPNTDHVFVCRSNRIILIDDFIGDWTSVIEEEDFNVFEEGYMGDEYFYRAAYSAFFGPRWHVTRLPVRDFEQSEILFSINAEDYGADRLIIGEMVEWRNPGTGELHLLVESWLNNQKALLVNYNVDRRRKEWELVDFVNNPNNNFNPNVKELRLVNDKILVITDLDIYAIDPGTGSIDWTYFSEGGVNSRGISSPTYIPSTNALLTISSGYDLPSERLIIDLNSGDVNRQSMTSTSYFKPLFYDNYILDFSVVRRELERWTYTLEVKNASDLIVIKRIEIPGFRDVALISDENCLILVSGKEFFAFDLEKIISS
jgi:outer membrane protein assembly factor BamB